MADAPVQVQTNELLLAFQMQQQAAFDAVPLDPQSCPGPGVKLCTDCCWSSRAAYLICPVNWEGTSLPALMDCLANEHTLLHPFSPAESAVRDG